MAISVTHLFVDLIPDNPAQADRVQPGDWNAAHVVTGAAEAAGSAGQVGVFSGAAALVGFAGYKYDSGTQSLRLGTVGGAAIWFMDSTIDPANPRLIMEQVAGAPDYWLRLRSEDDDGVGPIALIGVGEWAAANDHNGWKLTALNGVVNSLVSLPDSATKAELPWRIGTTNNFISLWTAATNPIDVFDAVGIGVFGTANRFIFRDNNEGGSFYVNGGFADLGREDAPWVKVIAADVVMSSGAASVIILPTADPEIVGALWNNAGTITISAG